MGRPVTARLRLTGHAATHNLMTVRPSTSPAASSPNVAPRSSSVRSLLTMTSRSTRARERVLDEARHIGHEPSRSHQRLLDRLAHDEVESADRELLTGVDDANERRRTEGPRHRQRLLRGRHAPDRLEREVHPALCEALNRRDRVVVRRVDDIRRAAAAGDLEFGVIDVDRDDPLRVRQARALDCREADAAASDDRNGRTRRHLGCVEDCAEAREHATPEQARTVERHRRIDAHQMVLTDQHVLGEPAETAELVDGFVAAAKARRRVRGARDTRRAGHSAACPPRRSGRSARRTPTGTQPRGRPRSRAARPARRPPPLRRAHGRPRTAPGTPSHDPAMHARRCDRRRRPPPARAPRPTRVRRPGGPRSRARPAPTRQLQPSCAPSSLLSAGGSLGIQESSAMSPWVTARPPTG